jgi:hypothetical protein
MSGNISGIARAFLITFGPQRVQIYTHDEASIADEFLALGLDAIIQLADGDAAIHAERRLPARAGAWDLALPSAGLDRIAVLYDVFRDKARGVEAIAWLCRHGPEQVLVLLPAANPQQVAALEAAFAEAGYEAHPRAARLSSAVNAIFPVARAYRRGAATWREAGPSALALNLKGARSAMTRLDLAAQFVRPGDLVFDESGWDGSGAVVLHANSAARHTLSLAADDGLREAMETRYGAAPDIDFAVAATAAERPDFIYFEPNRIVRLAKQLKPTLADIRKRLDLLTPAGRLVVAIGLDRRADRAGLARALIAGLASHAIVERTFGQNLSSLASEAGELFEASGDLKCEADFLILVAMISPIMENAPVYVEHAFAAPQDDRFQVARFDRAYERPWIVKGLVARGMRPENPGLLRELAARVQSVSPQASGDYGAALCVEAYQVAADDVEAVDALRSKIATWLNGLQDQPPPPLLRWQVSLLAVLSRLHLFRGDMDAALDTCVLCASIDVTPFSPLLGSKTLEALNLAATICLSKRDGTAARSHLRNAVEQAERLLSGDWINIIGDPERPLIFGLPEAAQLISIAARSSVLLTRFDELAERGGATWSLMLDIAGQNFPPVSASRPTDSAPPSTGAGEAALREVADARGQVAEAFATAAVAKDQAADAYAQLAVARQQAAATVEAALREVANARGQAINAFATATVGKDQAAEAYAQLAVARQQAAATVEEALREVANARGQAINAFATATVGKDQAAEAYAQLAVAHQQAAVTAAAAQREVAEVRAELAAAKRQAVLDIETARAAVMQSEVQPREERLLAMAEDLERARLRAEGLHQHIES